MEEKDVFMSQTLHGPLFRSLLSMGMKMPPPQQGRWVAGCSCQQGLTDIYILPRLFSGTHAYTAGTAAGTSHWATRLYLYALLSLVPEHVGMLPWYLSRGPLHVHAQL